MVAVTFLSSDGMKTETSAPNSLSLMEAARNANVPGILAECGGACACSTCHVYIAPEWVSRLPPADEMEADRAMAICKPDPEAR